MSNKLPLKNAILKPLIIYSWIFYLIISLSCAPKIIRPTIPKDLPPNEIPRLSFNQLKNQKSFRFNLHFKTDIPALVEAEFEGSVVLPNQEERTGTWQQMGEKVTTQIKGVGDFQHELKEGKWEIHPRGEESNILIEIERILTFSQFEFISKDSRQMVFTFKPNLVFLDPTRTKPMNGVLFIQSSSLLPERIRVSDSAKTTFWGIQFNDYNRIKKFAQPFIPVVRIQLTSESKIDSKAKSVLIERFQRLGYQSKTKAISAKPGTILEIQLERDISEPILNLLISQGEVKIYSGDWLEAETTLSDTGQIKYFQFKPVKVLQLIFTNQAIERAEPILDQGPEPTLDLYLNPKNTFKYQGPGKYLFLELNNELIGYSLISPNQSLDKLTFKEIGDVIKVTTIATIINSGQIKHSFKFLSKNSF